MKKYISFILFLGSAVAFQNCQTATGNTGLVLGTKTNSAQTPTSSAVTSPSTTTPPAAPASCGIPGATCVGGGVICLKPGQSTTLNLTATIPSPNYAAAGWGTVYNGNDLGYISNAPLTCVATGVSGVTSLQNTASGKICNVVLDQTAHSASALTVFTVDANATPGPSLYPLGALCSGCTVAEQNVQIQVVCP